MKRIVIIGATSAIAQACAMRWLAAGPVDLTLVGRDIERIRHVCERLAADASGSLLHARAADFFDPAAVAALADSLAAAGPIDIVLIAQGSYPDQRACQDSLDQVRAALDINAVSPALFAEAFAGHLAAQSHGTLAVIGSLAGDRGRRSNYVYGAAKGLLARYTQGLRHRFAGTGVRVVLIKPGPVDTPMTAVAKGRGTKVADPALVARDIVDAIARGRAVVYTPARWRYTMLALIHLPGWIFNRLDI